MKQFEYEIIGVPAYTDKLAETLKEMGIKGWELCGMWNEAGGAEPIIIHLFFKREM